MNRKKKKKKRRWKRKRIKIRRIITTDNKYILYHTHITHHTNTYSSNHTNSLRQRHEFYRTQYATTTTSFFFIYIIVLTHITPLILCFRRQALMRPTHTHSHIPHHVPHSVSANRKRSQVATSTYIYNN